MTVRCQACRRIREYPLEQPGGRRSRPDCGDFWLCPRCGTVHRFTGGWVVENNRVTELQVRLADLVELELLDVPLREALLAKRAEIRGPAS